MSLGSKRQGSGQAQGCWIRPASRLKLYERDNFVCQIAGPRCLGDMSALYAAGNRQLVTLDHIIPSSRGGSNHPSNLRTACKPCNSSRQDKE